MIINAGGTCFPQFFYAFSSVYQIKLQGDLTFYKIYVIILLENKRKAFCNEKSGKGEKKIDKNFLG